MVILRGMDPVSAIAFSLGAGSFLFDVFDKSVQAYGLYTSAKDFASVSKHMIAKLLIEERRLIQWGQGVGIEPIPHDITHQESRVSLRLKDNQALSQTVSQTLAGIEETLTDIDGLTSKYGLSLLEERIAGESPQKGEIVIPLHPPKSQPTSNLVAVRSPGSKTLKTIQSHSRRLQISTTLRKKFTWAVKDKGGFELLLDRLQYYNDSLYSLLPKESVYTITRDVLAELVVSSTSERLSQYVAAMPLSPQGEQVHPRSEAQYTTIASAAKTALDIAISQGPVSQDVWIEERAIRFDDEWSRTGTFTPRNPRDRPMRVFVEIIPHQGSLAKSIVDLYTYSDQRERLSQVASLLKEPRHVGFATMRCLGILECKGPGGHSELTLVYELPSDTDPLSCPVSLYEILISQKHAEIEPPTIDERFQLVSLLANALYEMHCSGWLHKNISSRNIYFFRIQDGYGSDNLDLARPYVTGFEGARRLVSGRSCPIILDDEASIFQHPGYILHKTCASAKILNEDSDDQLFFMPRHDYYSLGLVSLEIGMWRSLADLVLQNPLSFNLERNPSSPDDHVGRGPAAGLPSDNVPPILPASGLSVKLHQLEENVRSARGEILLKQPSRIDLPFLAMENNDQCNAYTQGYRTLVEEEGLNDISLDEKSMLLDLHVHDDLRRSSHDERYAWRAWDVWDHAYSHQQLREDAVRVCTEKLGSRMGRRYREAVRRCLATDFEIDPRIGRNIDWLRAFNWKVLQELNKCSA